MDETDPVPLLWQPNFNGLCIRKWYALFDETLISEGGRIEDREALQRVAIGVAIRNPYAGGYQNDLSEAIEQSEHLGREFGRRIKLVLGSRAVESYGKACVVGSLGEYEHGNAFLTTKFAGPIRDALGGALAWIPSTGKVGGPQTSIDIPLAHKDALYVRSHYDTFSVCLGDAPAPAEIVLLFACATRGRLDARLGGLTSAEVSQRDGLR
ncbi:MULTISPECIES: amino acid synthesis family protein [unclassified Beijerinckia]|uniref:amino acid synthesis family protein n=1 Tax=unclassified Beijerinckia TaxID=2638183 RepID=UPI00089D2F56|nr:MULTISPECIES: amino acid synthesis family protein [unclassified Beijerinckia]MDH7799277.1 hypothetical protein [Beijerinckia sp. GAS462]SED89894.1 Amino acid synthesis [Beijerinckia sp. 28-YEA-48]